MNQCKAEVAEGDWQQGQTKPWQVSDLASQAHVFICTHPHTFRGGKLIQQWHPPKDEVDSKKNRFWTMMPRVSKTHQSKFVNFSPRSYCSERGEAREVHWTFLHCKCQDSKLYVRAPTDKNGQITNHGLIVWLDIFDRLSTAYCTYQENNWQLEIRGLTASNLEKLRTRTMDASYGPLRRIIDYLLYMLGEQYLELDDTLAI